MMQASLHCATEMKRTEALPHWHIELCQNLNTPEGAVWSAEGSCTFYQAVQVLGTRDQEWGERRGLGEEKKKTERRRGGEWHNGIGTRERRGAAGVRRSLVECSHLADRQSGAMVETLSPRSHPKADSAG